MTALFFAPNTERACESGLHRSTSPREAEAHALCCDCFDCLPGWPARATAVRPDDTRLVPAPRYMAERLKEEARAQRYRRGPSRQRYLASQRRQNELSGLVRP